jgi:hypothetical protein
MLAIAVGLLALIQNLNIFAVTQGLVLGLLFVAVGIFCVAFYYIKSKNQAVLLIGLLGLFWGIGLLLNEFDILRADYKTIYFLFGSGLSFLAIYLHISFSFWHWPHISLFVPGEGRKETTAMGHLSRRCGHLV